MTGKDILNMENGQSISKSVLYNLIVNSKDESSENWGGEEYVINNTPQQGINWIGSKYKTHAVILKSKEGKYAEDSHGKRYAFKARKGKINKHEKANQVIIDQPKYKYPLMYFIENNNSYKLIGRFAVDKVFNKDVSLIPFDNKNDNTKEDSTNSKEGKSDRQTGNKNIDEIFGYFNCKYPFEENELEYAYREMIKKYHPDKVSDLGEEFIEMAERKTKEINYFYKEAMMYINIKKSKN
jgi:putative restriction endonuclease